MRIGHGFDVHALGPGDHIILGGVRIPHDRGLLAHSDGDVLIHALCDALLGAAGLGDIGQLFPDTDAEHAGRNSGEFLDEVMVRLAKQQLAVGNVDATIIAQQPKLEKFIPQMRSKLAQRLQVTVGAVNVKATTHEKIGALGRGEGIAVHAVALLVARH